MSRINTYKRKDGRFESRIYAGRDSSGRRKYRSFYGLSAYEAEQKAADALALTQSAEITDMTVRELASEWLCVMSARIKLSTAANYRMKTEKHILPEFGEIQCSSLSGRDIYTFINSRLAAGLSPRYVSDIVVLMRSMFRYAEREYNIRNVLEGIVMPKKPRTEVRLLSASEQKRLYQHALGSGDSTGLAVMLSLTAGLRIGELCALRWEDIDLKKRTLTVRKTVQRIQRFTGGSRTELIVTEPKSESSKRVIPLPKSIISTLLKVKGESECHVISGTSAPTDPRTLQYRFARLLKNVKLPSVHFHSLRHAFATNAIAAGFDVKTLSEILGHSSVEITLNRYVHSSFERKRSCMELIKWSA